MENQDIPSQSNIPQPISFLGSYHSSISSSIHKNNALKMKLEEKDFLLETEIGIGTFGKVYRSKRISNQNRYAIKVLKRNDGFKKTKTKKNQDRKIFEEIQILGEFETSFPFILNLLGWYVKPEEIHIVLQLAEGGDLQEKVNRQGKISEREAGLHASEIALALEYIHSKRIIFRDLKLSNVLLTADEHVLLTDFGLSKKTNSGRASVKCGTLYAMAPEMIKGLEYTKSVDWYGLGVLLYEMVRGRRPFVGSSSLSLESVILEKEVQFPSRSTLSEACKDLIKYLMTKDPENRPSSLDEVTSTTFMKNFFE